MFRARYQLVLASSGLALIVAIPLGSMAQDLNKLTAAPAASTSAELASTPTPVARTAPTTAVSETTTPDHDATIEQASAPDPLASLGLPDRAIAEKLRDLLATKLDKYFANKKEGAAVAAFYENRHSAPLWLEKGVENARAASVITRMKGADADGLEPGDYKAPEFSGLEPEALAEAELKLTQTVLKFARHLQAGRFPYSRASRNIELPQALPEPTDVLNRIADAGDAGQTLDAFSPQQEPYRKLKAMLAELRSKSGVGKDDSKQIATVIANMERWRWYPRELGSAHVIVNQPDFTLAVIHEGAQVWSTRIVIGKPSMPTPLLSETIKSITVNPTWHVPQSIIHNEYLPALAQDPTVLDRMGLRVRHTARVSRKKGQTKSSISATTVER